MSGTRKFASLGEDLAVDALTKADVVCETPEQYLVALSAIIGTVTCTLGGVLEQCGQVSTYKDRQMKSIETSFDDGVKQAQKMEFK